MSKTDKETERCPVQANIRKRKSPGEKKGDTSLSTDERGSGSPVVDQG